MVVVFALIWHLASRIKNFPAAYFMLTLFISFQLVKEFDVIHTPNQVGDLCWHLCTLCVNKALRLQGR